ncbi:MAG: hypothetical protein GX345_06050 [Clostridiales bacterium]|nr:hypothetical protein [Clostridiales bacterium]
MRILKKTIAFIFLISLVLSLIGCTVPTDCDQGQAPIRGETVDLTEAIKNKDKIEFKLGDLAILGAYEQDGDRENGPERIEWMVLALEEDKALLLSEKILDSKAYNQEHAKVTWESCSLRAWLNDEFYKTAFSEEEKQIILASLLSNENTYKKRIEGGNDTEDKVFLLSYNEATNPTYGFNPDYSQKDSLRLAGGSDYAISQGLFVIPSWKENESSDYNYWWLRSPGGSQKHSTMVRWDGSIFRKGYYVNYSYIGVRPAVWIKL